MSFSPKQKQILTFPYESDYDALICDGAVRSGKTSIMSLSFVLWMMAEFNHCSFAFCGKSVGAVERNIIQPLLSIRYLQQQFQLSYNRSGHVLIVRRGDKKNRVYLFGGKDESSYMLIQGITLAGVLLDEVALMPRSFVEQALARCSVAGAKFWFNCNPENPEHWFRKEWILQAKKHRALHLHFLMDDNPSLDERTRERYRSMYSGVFYERYILGRWVMAEGLIYDMFDLTANTYKAKEEPIGMRSVAVRWIGVDYGTRNDTVMLEAYDDGETLWITSEYRWASRKEHRQKTDEEYADDFMQFMGREPCAAIVDPSAASFIEALRRRGVYVMDADNDVLNGIRRVGTLLSRREIRIHESCICLLDELGTYRWDDKAALVGLEKPVKENDHGCDALRYLCNTAIPRWRYGE